MTLGARGLHNLLFAVVAAIAVSPSVALAMGIGNYQSDRDRFVSEMPASAASSSVAVAQIGDGSFEYLVNGIPQTFLGIGYNPIYRYLTDNQRAENYDRDFLMMCRAGLNHITGWDADKGYEQDKFDELTLNYAQKYGIGVVMPIYLPADGDYTDEAFTQELMAGAEAKVEQYKAYPAVRMWGVGNEVLNDMPEGGDVYAFGAFYVRLVDQLHAIDPSHPIIYREAEDTHIPTIAEFLADGVERPWLLYGANVYSARLEQIIHDWPSNGLDRPLIVTEFGAEPEWLGQRAYGYLAMWQEIRSRPQYVLGGAPYVWTTQGPEPTDQKWGLMDANGNPIDATFDLLLEQWRSEPMHNQCNY